MNHSFDPGYGEEPFRTLVGEYPEADVYPPSQFRVEWGPIFRGGSHHWPWQRLVANRQQEPAW